MKLFTHDKIGKPQTMTLGFKPFVVFLTKKVEMHIEPGDTLEDIARVVRRHWIVDLPTARQIVALWFALGERLSLGNPDTTWQPKELRVNIRRTYAPKHRALSR
jgi:hypothetical protein